MFLKFIYILQIYIVIYCINCAKISWTDSRTTEFDHKTNIYRTVIIEHAFALSILDNKPPTTGMQETGRVSAELGLTQQGQHGLRRQYK